MRRDDRVYDDWKPQWKQNQKELPPHNEKPDLIRKLDLSVTHMSLMYTACNYNSKLPSPWKRERGSPWMSNRLNAYLPFLWPFLSHPSSLEPYRGRSNSLTWRKQGDRWFEPESEYGMETQHQQRMSTLLSGCHNINLTQPCFRVLSLPCSSMAFPSIIPLLSEVHVISIPEKGRKLNYLFWNTPRPRT